jgi:hypothetical protein
VVARAVWRWVGSRLRVWESEIDFWSQAAYGVLPLYGAWVTGAVLGADCGMSGLSTERWGLGAAVSAGILALVALALRLPRLRAALLRWYGPGEEWWELWDEPRWAMYRGAFMAAGPAVGQIIGFLLGGIEWLLREGPPSRGAAAERWSGLIRLGVSAGFFAITRSLWLTLAAQAAIHALFRNRWTPPVSET